MELSGITAEEQADAAQLMYASAVDVVEGAQQVEKEATKSPLHFDLVGLATGLKKTVSVTQHISKLRQHVSDAEKALKTHEGHVQDIKELYEKADEDTD